MKHEIKTFTTPSDYKADLQKTLSGWRQHLLDQENVVISSFDSAPKVVFQSFITTNSKARIFLTDSSFGRNIVSGKTVYSVTNLRRYGELAKCSFGTEQGGKLTADYPELCVNKRRDCFTALSIKAPYCLISCKLKHRASKPATCDDSKTHNHKKVRSLPVLQYMCIQDRY